MMTICITKMAMKRKFFAKCLFTDDRCEDSVLPLLGSLQVVNLRGCTIHFDTDMSIKEVEDMLKKKGVKYEWIQEF